MRRLLPVAVVALAGIAWLPATAASEVTAKAIEYCQEAEPGTAGSYECYERKAAEEKAAEEAAEAAEAAAEKHAEEEAQRSKEEASVQLHIKETPHATHEYQRPGYTIFKVTTQPDKSDPVRIELRLQKEHTWAYTHDIHAVVIHWFGCPTVATWEYVVLARPLRGGTGKWTVRRTGHFKVGEPSRCTAIIKTAERAAEEAYRRLKREEHENQLFRENCGKLGGEVITLQTSKGAELYCKSPSGGGIPVPHALAAPAGRHLGGGAR